MMERADYELTTTEEYWNVVERYKDQLLDLIAKYHPYYRRSHLTHHITAEKAERACEAVRKQIADARDEDTEDPQQTFRRYLKFKSDNIVTLFNETWFGMPESREVRSEPGFGELCDLCSEAWVLDPNCEGADICE